MADRAPAGLWGPKAVGEVDLTNQWEDWRRPAPRVGANPSFPLASLCLSRPWWTLRSAFWQNPPPPHYCRIASPPLALSMQRHSHSAGGKTEADRGTHSPGTCGQTNAPLMVFLCWVWFKKRITGVVLTHAISHTWISFYSQNWPSLTWLLYWNPLFSPL